MRQVRVVGHDGYIVVAQLKACAGGRDLKRGVEVHAHAARLGLLENNNFVGSALVSLYSRCGLVSIAEEVFARLSVPDVISWNALITGLVNQGLCVRALRCFEQLQSDGVLPNPTTFICVLKACGSLKAIAKGQEIHFDIEKRALQGNEQAIGNALVHMYSKCGSIETARHVFDRLPFRDICAWNSLIAGLSEHGFGEEAFKCLQKMRLRGISPDAITLSCGLKVCSMVGAIFEGGNIHAEIERQGLLEKDLFLGSTLVNMYANTGLLSRAQHVFERLSLRGVVTWTTLIAGYAEKGRAEEALSFLDQMQFEGFLPNAITLVWCLKACQIAAATGKGEEIHAEIERRGILDEELIGNSLVDMYAKGGSLAKACDTFGKLRHRDVVSWTALMAGFVQFGENKNVFTYFDKMVLEGVSPTPVTFAVVLSACTRIGFYDTFQIYFEAMHTAFGIGLALEHCNCVVSILSCVGKVEHASAMVKLFPNLGSWQIVLGACRRLGSLKFGKEAYELGWMARTL